LLSEKRFVLESRHVKILLFSAIVLSASILGTIIVLRSRSSPEMKTGGNHFSVVWKGFKPTYSDAFPDYYVCINNLKDDSLRMYIQLKIENYENVSLYFMIDKYTEPPPGWFVGPQPFGLIKIEDPIKTFTYSNVYRTKPIGIPEGSLHESVELAVKAYLDEAYTQFYSQGNFTVKFHFIDVTSIAWTRRSCDNFDDETSQGWSGGQLHKWVYYRSWPCSWYTYYWGVSKSFDMAGKYTEAYLVAAMYGGGEISIWLDDVLTFQSDVSYAGGKWYQIAIPLPLNKVTKVSLQGGVYLDDVYVVAK